MQNLFTHQSPKEKPPAASFERVPMTLTYSRFEKQFIVGCLVVIFLSILWLLVGERFYSQLSFIQPKDRIGTLLVNQNDVRIKTHGTWNWKNGLSQYPIGNGDRVFVGPRSRASVLLAHSGRLYLEENTLIAFDTNSVSGDGILMLEGRVRIEVDGELPVRIGNETVVIKGKQAQVEIDTQSKKGGPHRGIVIKKGQATVHKTAPKSPPSTAPILAPSLASTTAPPSTFAPATPQTPPSESLSLMNVLPNVTPVIPELLHQTNSILYYWKFEDLYSVVQTKLVAQTERPKQVTQPHRLFWQSSQTGMNHSTLEVTCTETETTETFETQALEWNLSSVCLGLTLWKVSFDQKHWSDPGNYVVTADYHPALKFSFEQPPTPLVLKGPFSESLRVHLKTRIPVQGFVVQKSSDLGFSDWSSELDWIPSTELTLTFDHPGTYYYRMRMVNTQNQISDWSKALIVNVIRTPPKPSPMPLAKKVPVAPLTPVPETTPRFPATMENPPYVLSQTLRTSAPPRSLLTNQNYNASHLDFQPMVWALQSSTQIELGYPIYFATGLSLKAIDWWNSLGIESLFKTKVMGFYSNSNSSIMNQVEVRLHKRWFTPFPFRLTRALQIGAFAGFENYNNSSTLFTSKYNLFKFGNLIEFPWRAQWAAGGEFVYGVAKDGSTKKEISGHMNYFWNRQMSLGIGYRLHLFQAVTAASSADGLLPYREGYTEGYSIMSYYF